MPATYTSMNSDCRGQRTLPDYLRYKLLHGWGRLGWGQQEGCLLRGSTSHTSNRPRRTAPAQWTSPWMMPLHLHSTAALLPHNATRAYPHDCLGLPGLGRVSWMASNTCLAASLMHLPITQHGSTPFYSLAMDHFPLNVSTRRMLDHGYERLGLGVN